MNQSFGQLDLIWMYLSSNGLLNVCFVDQLVSGLIENLEVLTS